MKAVILVGGLGTRLRSVVPDLPKPMAPIGDKPFLAYLISYLKSQGITDVVLSVCHLREKIQAYFQSSYDDVSIQYVIEETPLGTGGAMQLALAHVAGAEPTFVINGDTFVECDYRAMYQQHVSQRALLTMALRHVDDAGRYGKVVTQDQLIVEFKEKGASEAGLINAGVYLMNPQLFDAYLLPERFSFESDFLLQHLQSIQPQAFMADEYFIDIGIPEDYARAQRELSGA